ncbi:Transposase-like protein [Elusimicrobium minutum Pei191]|uniref:Transposase-like protein n=1 Tax=Elusimicrobium minutum (strain Pei191) TaxID=445932 RepID=B2KC23_ELUMP|nr:transposase [Elusimicrobium minutum]ACC98150.1 Transposase-like protein [Elusimicrobium minutum Pei191]
MPRKLREVSKTSVYHVMIRGVNRQNIFEEESDYVKFLNILKDIQAANNFVVYAYCFMPNHLHMLIKDDSLSKTMQVLLGKYASFYNLKYDRTGYLFQDRFKSEAVENDSYFLTVLRYIHQNPVSAGLAQDVTSYRWSSMYEYMSKPFIVSASHTLKMFKNNISSFISFNKEKREVKSPHLKIKKEQKISDSNIQKFIKNELNISAGEIKSLDIEKLAKTLKQLSEKGASVRQLQRVTGISKSSVARFLGQGAGGSVPK